MKLRCGPNAREILSTVARSHGVKVADIKGPGRFRSQVFARQDAMWRLYSTGRYSFPEIGRFLNRDHSTVIHGVRVHAKRLEAE